jgi:hypothetical protein
MSFDESRGHIENTLRETKANRRLLDWVDTQKTAVGFVMNLQALRDLDLPQPAWKGSIAKESPEEEQYEPGAPIRGPKARDRARRSAGQSTQDS